MAHVELSFSGPHLQPPPFAEHALPPSLEHWAVAVAAAAEPCLLLDRHGIVVAASPTCGRLLGLDPYQAVGRRLVDGVVHLLDFNAVAGQLPEWEVEKIPPMLPLSTGGLARGLLRVPGVDGPPCTVDAISTPLREGPVVVGSLTFFAPVRR